MKIAFNPSTVAALTTPPNNKDITFDLRGRNIFARGVKFYGTDTNTWRDIKINNVSIGSHTLDLQNGSNTTLTNTNGVVTINSTWRPVVDNLTSDSTTSSLSAKQGKVLKALIDGKSNSDHNHDGRYLKLTGGTMASNALITFADSGSWDTNKKPQGARGGLYWTGQSDQAKLYAEETVGDNLDLVIQFGDDNSNGLSIRNKANTQTSYISSSGVITTGTFKGNLDWSYITNKPATATRWPSWAEVTGKPSSFTPSTHTHGLSNSVFFLNMPSINGNAKWKEVFGYPVNYNLLLSVRINNPAPEWCVGNFGSGILYGGSDTKGFMSSAYNEPFIMWAGGNGSSDDSVPKWYIGIKGTHKSIYNLATIASEANAAYNLRHSHANKSVLDGITSALVNSWNTAYNFVSNITGTNTDKVINKWEEIVNFLAGITEDNKLNTLLNSKLSVYELADNTNVGTIKNNGIYYSTIDASSETLINSPFNTGFAFINMTSYDGGDDLRRSRLAFNAFGEIKVSDDRDQANTAETWYNVLTSKNSGINGSTIKLNGTSITVYSSGTADGRYVRAFGTSNDNIDSDWGQSFKTFDPIPSGTPPEQNPNISILNIGENFNRRKQLAFIWNNDNIYYRRHTDSGFTNWRRLAFANEIPTSVLTWKSQVIDMRSYSESYWHPVTVHLPGGGYNKIKVSVQLNSGDKPSWATHNNGITCNMEIWATADGWGTTDSDTICLNYTYKFCSQNPCGWMQLGYPSLGVVFLRGGSRYTVYTDFDATFTPHNQKYTWSNNSVSQDTGGPYTSCPGLNFNMGTIHADLIATRVQARRVCAGHDPGIDNSISCSNWFRSSGNTGWYNTTYQGGWYMSDTSWIRAHNGVGIYTSGQIYSSSSIRMSNILLEHTDEINNSANGGIYLNYRNSGNVSLCYGGGNVGIGTTTPSYKLDVNGQMRASGFHHSSVNSDNYILLAGGGYKSFGGDDSTPIFLGCLDLYRGYDGTISSSFYCLGYSVPFTYTRGGNYCKIVIPDTTRLSFYIIAAIASVNYSGGGMDTWVGEHRGEGAWWLHCQAFGRNEVRVKGFHLANHNNDSWWGGNPLYSGNGGANKITVCIFGHVKYK